MTTDPREAEACPICGRAVTARFRPFCSARCAEVDLGRWLTDVYAIPVSPDEDDGASGPPPDTARPHDG